jgi:hypothetical protein
VLCFGEEDVNKYLSLSSTRRSHHSHSCNDSDKDSGTAEKASLLTIVDNSIDTRKAIVTTTTAHTENHEITAATSSSLYSSNSNHRKVTSSVKISIVDKLILSKYSSITDVCYKSTARHIISPHSPMAARERASYFRNNYRSHSTNYNSMKHAIITEFELQKTLTEELVIGTITCVPKV